MPLAIAQAGVQRRGGVRFANLGKLTLCFSEALQVPERSSRLDQVNEVICHELTVDRMSGTGGQRFLLTLDCLSQRVACLRETFCTKVDDRHIVESSAKLTREVRRPRVLLKKLPLDPYRRLIRLQGLIRFPCRK